MAMTMTQKILAAAAGLDFVEPGQLIEAGLDMVLGNDITSPVAINEFERCGAHSVFDRGKIALVLDHFSPSKDIKAAQQCRQTRQFAGKYDIEHFFDAGEMGIEHALLPEKGLVGPGGCIIGADSHTCTYGALGAFSTGVGSTDMAAAMITGKAWFKVPPAVKVVLKGKPSGFVSGKDVILHLIGAIGVDGALYQSLEFTGDGVSALSMDDRFTIANMAIEAGAKNGIFPVDEKTLAYCEGRYRGEVKIFEPDPDAVYERTVEIDLSALKPTVAMPHLPENTRTIGEAGRVKIDQSVIGSCTNGRISDMRVAAGILKGRKVAKGVRCIVIPATQEVYLQCVQEGLTEIFIEAGAVFSTPTCGPCLGGYMGILAEGERAVSTTNRNFVGRMGHPESEVVLASPAVAAASAVTGYLTDPSALARIGDAVAVTVDRPLGSTHPKHPDMVYPVNYGYVPGLMAPDGDEQDAYILGVAEPLESFTGRLIAVIHRFDDAEEKWVLAPEGMGFSEEEIIRLTHFQEQYFHIEVRM